MRARGFSEWPPGHAAILALTAKLKLLLYLCAAKKRRPKACIQSERLSKV